MWLSDFRVATPDRMLEHGSVRIEAGGSPESRGCRWPERLCRQARQHDRTRDGTAARHADADGTGQRDLDRRFAVAGVTTAYAAIGFHPGSAYGHIRSHDHTKAMIRALKGMSNALEVDLKVHQRFEIIFPNVLTVVQGLIAEGSVDLVSLTDHTPGQGQYRDLEAKAARAAAEKGVPIAAVEQDLDRGIADKLAAADDLAATLAAISATRAAHGVAIANHDDTDA